MDLICCPPVDVEVLSLAIAKCRAKNRLNSFQTVSFGSHKASWFWGICFYFYKMRSISPFNSHLISPFGKLICRGQKYPSNCTDLKNYFFKLQYVLALRFSLQAEFINTFPYRGAQLLSNLWLMPTSVSKGFDTVKRFRAVACGLSLWSYFHMERGSRCSLFSRIFPRIVLYNRYSFIATSYWLVALFCTTLNQERSRNKHLLL